MTIKDDKKKSEIRSTTVYPGKQGVGKKDKGFQFTLAVPKGSEAELLLYEKGEAKPFRTIPFTRENACGNLVSVYVEGISSDQIEYNYRVDKKIVQDPYARNVKGTKEFGVLPEEEQLIRCGLKTDTYKWKNPDPEFLPMEDTILYKLQVREYTMQKNSGVRSKGTFRGLEQKAGYFKDLGITSLLFMPVYEYREIERPVKKGRQKSAYLCEDVPKRVNCWGYTSDASYFMPKAAFCASDRPLYEFSHMVDTFHKEGLECILEFYFDGNTAPSFMLDVLRYWKITYHIDGFHLMGQGICPELFIKDPVLAGSKLFFAGLNSGMFTEEQLLQTRNTAVYDNGFLYCMRHLLKGDENMLREFTQRNKRNPKETGVINFLADQDGFTYMDLVSYDEKHNEANGEENRDGVDYNCSWNCGVEGPTRKMAVRELRQRQLKNAFMLLLLSQGTPLIFQGDEFGNSQMGNNNAWCQDNETGWVNWGVLRSNKALLEFVKELIHFRKENKILHMEQELKGSDYRSYGFPDISYHGTQAWYVPEDPDSRHMGIMYCSRYAGEKGFLYIAYNLHWMQHEFALPNVPKAYTWSVLTDTSGEQSKIIEKTEKRQRKGHRKLAVEVPPRTIVILSGKQETD